MRWGLVQIEGGGQHAQQALCTRGQELNVRIEKGKNDARNRFYSALKGLSDDLPLTVA